MSNIRKSVKDRKILLALAIPNLIKARISANEANARKAMQTLRDAEGEYFEQDLDNDGVRDYSTIIGTLTTDDSLRNPEGTNEEEDALIDNSFEDAEGASCADPKAGYCIDQAADPGLDATDPFDDFGWEATMTSFRKTGRKDFSVYADGVIRCTVPDQATGSAGTFTSDRTDAACD